MSFQRLGDVTSRIAAEISAKKYTVLLIDPLAKHLEAYAEAENAKVETIIAEAVRAYVGDAA